MEKLEKRHAIKLLSLVPMIISWLSMNSENVGLKLAMRANNAKSNVSMDVLRALKKLLRSRSLIELSNTAIRDLFKEIGNEILYRSLFTILSNTKSPLFTADCYNKLRKQLSEMEKFLSSEVSPLDLAKAEYSEFLEDITETVHRLPIVNYYALIEVCGVLSSNKHIMGKACELIAPRMLLPEEDGAFEFKRTRKETKQGSSSITSINVMQIATEVEINDSVAILLFLCKFYDVVFCRTVGEYKAYSGYRENVIVKQSEEAIRNIARAKQLQDFYEKIDPDYVSIASRLFEFFEFPVIAEAIWTEYGYLPAKWIGQLALHRMELDKDSESMAGLAWFEQRRDSLVEFTPKDISEEPLPEKEFVLAQHSELLDKVVQEMFCGEDMYFKRLLLFRDVYVADLRSTAERATEKQIGLNRAEIKQVFGRRLHNLVDATRTWLIQLEVLRLIRSNVKPTSDGQLRTRAGLLAEVLIGHQEHFLGVYNDYTRTQGMCMQVVTKAMNTINNQKNKGGDLTFVALFNDFAKRYPDQMRGQGLDSLLNSPVRRFPQYTLFFERMLGILKKRKGNYSTEIERLKFATNICKSLSWQLNKAAEEERRLQKLMGHTPASATSL